MYRKHSTVTGCQPIQHNYRARSSAKLLLCLAFMVHTLTACTIVRHHEVKPLAESFDRTSEASHTILEKVQDDLIQKRGCLHSLQKQGAKMQSSPYSEIYALLDPLQRKAIHSENLGLELQLLKEKFLKVTRGKNQISSKSPDYAQVSKLTSRTESLMSELEKIAKAYKDTSKQFEDLTTDARVGQIDVPKTRAQLTGFLRKLDANIGLLRSRGSRVQANALGKDRATYNAITAKLVMIETQRAEVSKLISRFNQVAGSQNKIWTGPGLLTFTIMEQSEIRATNIRKIGDELQALAASPNE